MALRRRRGRRRERFEWTFGGVETPRSVAINTLDQFNFLTVANMEEFPRALLTRILGTIMISPATAPAAATGYSVAVGLTKIPTGTVAATFDPELQPDHRWTWWNICFPQLGGNGAADQNASRWAGYFRFDLDRRTKERFGPDEGFAICVKNSSVSGAAIQWAAFFRFGLAVGAK